MKRIVILTNSLSGLYSFRKELIDRIMGLGFEVIISSPIDFDVDFFEEKKCRILETVFDRKGKNPLKDIRLLFYYACLMKKEKPDVVLTYTIKPNLYGGMACNICGIPQIANITGLGSAVESPGIMQKLTSILYRIGLRKTTLVFFQNSANRDYCVERKLVKNRYVLIPGSGVNLDYHQYQDYPKKEPIRFVFISRLIKQKGVEEYFCAAEIIKQKYPNVEFHVVGFCEGRYQSQLDEMQKKRIIIYHGVVKDIRPIIGMTHCTIHPSYYPEGMSNVLLESCAAGRPVITTDRPGCGEIVVDGITGYIVHQQDVSDLVCKIERFIQLPYDEKVNMGKSGRKKVEKEFNRNIVVNAYIDEINRVTRNV